MSNEMTEAEFWAALAPVTEPPAPQYRLYHDEQGLPLFYTMQEEPGNYIEIDFETYSNPPKHVRVVDGKLKILMNNPVAKLVPSNSGTPCAPSDVCVVVDQNKPNQPWSLKKYDPS